MPLFYGTDIQIPARAADFVPGPYPVTTGSAGSFVNYDDLVSRRPQSTVLLGSHADNDIGRLEIAVYDSGRMGAG